jgi:hypothetical protein
MRLATRITAVNDEFSKDVDKRGSTIAFEGEAPASTFSLSGKEGRKASAINSKTNHTMSTPAVSPDILHYPELCDILQCPEPPEELISDAVLEWIEHKYKSSRGFELGAFNPAILPSIFREQTVRWSFLPWHT